MIYLLESYLFSLENRFIYIYIYISDVYRYAANKSTSLIIMNAPTGLSPRDICIKLPRFFQLRDRHKAGVTSMKYIKLDCYVWKGLTVQLMLHLRLFSKICQHN